MSARRHRLRNPCRATRRYALALALLTLAACSPRYNWREVQDGGAFSATFPARVAKQSQPLHLAQAGGSMEMTGAEVDHVSFVIGVLHLPPGSDALQMRQALDDSLAHQLEPSAPVFGTVDMALYGASHRVPAQSFELASAHMHMSGRIALAGDHLIEVLVAGPNEAFDDPQTREARETFFDSVRLL